MPETHRVDRLHPHAYRVVVDTRRVAAAWLALLCALGAAGCATSAGGLPTFDPGDFCSLAELLPVRIEGDRAADPPIWGVASNGSRVDLLWPIGFTLRATDGRLEVVDSNGEVVARKGEFLVGAGGGSAGGQPDAPFEICIIGTTIYTSALDQLPAG